MAIRQCSIVYDKQQGGIAFASEAKALVGFCRDILPFPPGHYYKNGEFICYNDIADPKTVVDHDIETIAKNSERKIGNSVISVSADAQLGFLK